MFPFFNSLLKIAVDIQPILTSVCHCPLRLWTGSGGCRLQRCQRQQQCGGAPAAGTPGTPGTLQGWKGTTEPLKIPWLVTLRDLYYQIYINLLGIMISQSREAWKKQSLMIQQQRRHLTCLDSWPEEISCKIEDWNLGTCWCWEWLEVRPAKDGITL